MRSRTRKLALSEGMTAGAFFGTAAILIRFLPDTDAFSIAFWRLAVACAGLTAILILLKRRFRFDLVKEHLKELLTLGLFLGLHFIFFVSAVKDTTILNATVLVNTTPIFTMLVSTLAFKLKPSRWAILGIAISFIGVCSIAYAETNNGNAATFSPSLKGDVEALLAALVEAVYLNIGRRVRSQIDILSTMLPIYFFSAIVIGVLSIPATGGTITLPTSVQVILPLVGLGLLPTAISHTLYFSSLSNLRSYETATMALIEPLGATLLGIAVFQEIPPVVFALGAGLILVGIFFTIENKS